MTRVMISTCCPQWPFARQTPGTSGRWEEFEFVFNRDGASCDAWVVYDNPGSTLQAHCDPRNTFFFTAEPPDLKSYNRPFLDQFRWVVSCHAFDHPGLISEFQSQPWHVGVDLHRGYEVTLDYDLLTGMTPPRKTGLISAAISDKAITVGHRQRLEFVRRLKNVLGDQLVLLGEGHQPLADKWEAVAPFRFHLALENTRCPHYVTEKIGDAFLGFAFPFYYGAPNIHDYYPAGSLETIDVAQPERSIRKICSAIENRLDEARAQQLGEARQLALEHWNLFPRLARLLRKHMVRGTAEPVQVHPKGQRLKLWMAGWNRKRRAA